MRKHVRLEGVIVSSQQHVSRSKKKRAKRNGRLVTFDVAVGDIRVHAQGVRRRTGRTRRREVPRLSSHSGGVVAPDGELLDVVDGAVGLWRGGEHAREIGVQEEGWGWR